MTLPAASPPKGYRQPGLEVQQWAARLQALRAMGQKVGEMYEAQILEQLWLIHRAFERESDFIFFAETELGMDGAAACHQVRVWGAAREDRQLREMAQSQPLRAMHLVTDLAHLRDSEIDPVGVTEVLALPARQRATAIDELLRLKKSHGHHPDDLGEIRGLRAERDAALAALAAQKKGARQPAEDLGLVLEGLAEIEKDIADLVELLQPVREHMTPTVRERLLRLTDLASGSLDGLAALAGEDDV